MPYPLQSCLVAGRLGHWNPTGIRYAGLGKGCSAHGDAVSGDLGLGSLGPLLSYHFLGTYCMPEAFHGFSNLTVIILQTHFTDRCVQGTGLRVRSREDFEGVKWRLRDVQDLLKALELEMELEARPITSKFPAIFTPSLPPVGRSSSGWGPWNLHSRETLLLSRPGWETGSGLWHTRRWMSPSPSLRLPVPL